MFATTWLPLWNSFNIFLIWFFYWRVLPHSSFEEIAPMPWGKLFLNTSVWYFFFSFGSFSRSLQLMSRFQRNLISIWFYWIILYPPSFGSHSLAFLPVATFLSLHQLAQWFIQQASSLEVNGTQLTSHSTIKGMLNTPVTAFSAWNWNKCLS